ncbi:MAG: hypothetical protein F4Y92_08020 [Dehalococcoidia bacterium]|nr:hypothetical protein [Dehalococcoidia bacterium]
MGGHTRVYRNDPQFERFRSHPIPTPQMAIVADEGKKGGRATLAGITDEVPRRGLRPLLPPTTLFPWNERTRLEEMKAAKQRERTRRGHPGGLEPRVVAVEHRPTPDSGARLRRIAAILLQHANRAASGVGESERREGL